MLLHNGKESDDDLRGRTNENLTLSTLLGVVDVVEAIGLFGRTARISFFRMTHCMQQGNGLTRTETRMAISVE